MTGPAVYGWGRARQRGKASTDFAALCVLHEHIGGIGLVVMLSAAEQLERTQRPSVRMGRHACARNRANTGTDDAAQDCARSAPADCPLESRARARRGGMHV
eukprot:6180982-Pleurochrysis_carterae.AAC.1